MEKKIVTAISFELGNKMVTLKEGDRVEVISTRNDIIIGNVMLITGERSIVLDDDFEFTPEDIKEVKIVYAASETK